MHLSPTHHIVLFILLFQLILLTLLTLLIFIILLILLTLLIFFIHLTYLTHLIYLTYLTYRTHLTYLTHFTHLTHLTHTSNLSNSSYLNNSFQGEVTNPKNIKAITPKILRPTHFSGTKDIKADIFLALINIKANLLKVNNNAKKGQKPDKY